MQGYICKSTARPRENSSRMLMTLVWRDGNARGGGGGGGGGYITRALQARLCTAPRGTPARRSDEPRRTFTLRHVLRYLRSTRVLSLSLFLPLSLFFLILSFYRYLALASRNAGHKSLTYVYIRVYYRISPSPADSFRDPRITICERVREYA